MNTWPARTGFLANLVMTALLCLMQGRAVLAQHFDPDAQDRPNFDRFRERIEQLRMQRPGGLPHAPRWNMEEQRNRIQDFLQEVVPEQFDELMSLKDKHPEAFQQKFHELSRWADHMMKIREKDPASFERGLDLFEREYQSRKLADRIKHEDDEAEKAAMKEELREVLQGIQEIKLEAEAEQVDKLEAKLVELKSRITKREEHLNAIVEARFQELTRSDDLAW